MKAGKYSVKELFLNRYVEQIIIPEIQRDYVWTSKEVEGLLASILEAYHEFQKAFKIESNLDPELNAAFEKFYKKQKCSYNIGFIYAYNDSTYDGKYFLIDGQQRLTTIYLLLLALASNSSSYREKFEKNYFSSTKPVLDYKVREASHQFLASLVVKYTTSDCDIKNQAWYHYEYANDKTISSVIKNIDIIQQFLKSNGLIKDEFILFIEDFVEFWYFDTNISEQGEELYIYLNARGEQMQENENLKADLLGKLSTSGVVNSTTLYKHKNDWGRKWEEWQQFFWEHRNDNHNADKGFNEFISCIAGLENCLIGNQIVYSKEDFDTDLKGKATSIAYSDIIKIVGENGLQKIDSYIGGLKYLCDSQNIERFKSNYSGITWIEKCLLEIWNILNSASTNWFADLKDENRGLEHSRMVFIWSILLYLNKIEVATTNTEIFRVLRVYYVRFKNYNRSVKSIQSDVENIKKVGPWKVLGIEEELKKNKWYSSEVKPEEITKYEELIWSIEDHPLNLDGRDARAINCSHLIDFNRPPDLAELMLITNRFYDLFPVNNNKVNYKNCKKLINILLSYGNFWERVSPWYYFNYNFGNWKKIIRNIDTQSPAFGNFFSEYKSKSLDTLYKEKVVDPGVSPETMTDLTEQLKWFAFNLNEKMWQQGYYIAVEHYNYPDWDIVFPCTKQILNTKGDFKGGHPQILSELLVSSQESV